MTGLEPQDPLDAFMLDERHRGVPPGHGPIASSDVAGQGWHPAGGAMALPLLSLDLAAFAGNRTAMMAVVRHFGAKVAPHAKTAMAPALARSLVDGGAWATSAKLNDQHAFLAVAPGTDIDVGDVVEFGVRHPCTCIDKHQVLYGVDGGGKVAAVFQTFFG